MAERDGYKPSGWRKLLLLAREETHGIRPRLHLLNFAASWLPRRGAGSARARLLELAGFSIGEGCELLGMPRLNGNAKLFGNLIIGEGCSIDMDCAFDLEERITIGKRVRIGAGVLILTSTHELDRREHRAGPTRHHPVVIEDGAFIGPRAIIFPDVTIGAGAIVNAGSVVNKSVPAHTRVGGTPAVQLEVLKADESPTA